MQGHFRLGEALFALEDFDSAEKAFARAHELVSTCAKSLQLLLG